MYKLSSNTLYKLAIYALSMVWIFTGVTSIFLAPDIGYQILKQANITGAMAVICVVGGGLLDISLGLWLLIERQVKWCCVAQIAVIVTYTLILTFIDSSFWLHPFGPITKNFPIVVLILFVTQAHETKLS